MIVDFRSKFAEVYTLTAVGQKILYRALQTLINVNFYLLNIFCRKVSWCFIECILAVFRNTCARPSECEFVGRRSKGTQFDTACFTNAVFQFEGSTSEINSIGVNGQINLTCIVFFLSVMFILFFARFGISRHLRRLTEAADEIKNGNFETPVISMLNTKRRDEIGVLNQSTKDEREFLNLFAKFTNKGVARAIARKEIDFEPHLKDVTIFFSDIRGFTAISDGFKNRFANDSPREIISFLNDYMSRMVNCITLSHGNVDKFEGDAIMAVWGLLRDDSLDFEKLDDSAPHKIEQKKNHEAHVKQDALNAITGTIAMRYALMKYNKDAALFTKEHEKEIVKVIK